MDMTARINHKTIPGILISLLLLLAIMITSDAQAAMELYFIHNDHLGTPLAVTDQNQNIVWRKRQKPFGEMTDGAGTQDPRSRFPGQYFDEESGYHYNYFRDYDPTIGRYIQSDPIGLDGGTNTYRYVGGNPLIFTDPDGLYFGIINSYRLENILNFPKLPDNPRGACRTQCFIDFFNPIPDNLTEKAAEKKFGQIGKDAMRKINKIEGGFDLSKCLDECNEPDCER